MKNTDLVVDVDTEPDEPARFNVRRMVRWVTVLAVGILAVLAFWQDPLYALHD
ncbi:MAG TPA: hypothetical protein VFO77_11840 [Actinoplanes sp.]|nr:hypothetical protein [Actinoplanes sp.]